MTPSDRELAAKCERRIVQYRKSVKVLKSKGHNLRALFWEDSIDRTRNIIRQIKDGIYHDRSEA